MKPLVKKTILVTSGPTYAPIDAVRVISNRSTGRLGSAIVHALAQAGARVIQLAGEASVSAADVCPPEDLTAVEVIRYGTVEELKARMQERLIGRAVDAVVMSAAVLDYVPAEPTADKQRSDREEWTVRLKRGEKLIERIRDWNAGALIVGFKLETRLTLDELAQRALDLMQRSDAELVVANRLEEIGDRQHIAYLMERGQETAVQISAPLHTRQEIAQALTQRLAERLGN